jgi:hypothetical protein
MVARMDILLKITILLQTRFDAVQNNSNLLMQPSLSQFFCLNDDHCSRDSVSELNQVKLQQFLEIIIYKGQYSTDSFCIWSDIAMRIPLMIIFSARAEQMVECS